MVSLSPNTTWVILCVFFFTFQESSEKIWDAESCTCRCRESRECSTGTYFDENSCSCQAVCSIHLNTL